MRIAPIVAAMALIMAVSAWAGGVEGPSGKPAGIAMGATGQEVGLTARADESSPCGQGIPLVWCRVADCESGDGDGLRPYTPHWHIDGYFDGGLQFLPSTWRAAIRLVPGWQPGYAHRASAQVQVRVAARWLRATSWEQWPVCSRKVGVR